MSLWTHHNSDVKHDREYIYWPSESIENTSSTDMKSPSTESPEHLASAPPTRGGYLQSLDFEGYLKCQKSSLPSSLTTFSVPSLETREEAFTSGSTEHLEGEFLLPYA